MKSFFLEFAIRGIALAVAFGGGGLNPTLVHASAPQLRDLSPVQVYAAPQVSVDPPVALAEPVDPISLSIEEGGSEAEAIYDIPYSYFWNDDDLGPWRRQQQISTASPGLRGSRVAWRPGRGRSPWLPKTSDDPWTLGASNWRYSGDEGLDVTLGNEQIEVPAWGSSARLGGISVSQSSMMSSDSSQTWQYSMSFGALDYSSDQPEGDLQYGPTASNTVLRYGISPSLTLESQLELAPDLMTSGVGGEYDTAWGVWSAGVARASYGLYKGWRYQAAYSVDLTEDIELSWLSESHTAGFASLSRYRDGSSPGGVRQQWTATVPTGRWGDVSGVYENERSSLGETRRTFGLTQQFWYSPNLRIGLEAQRELVTGDYDIGLQLSVPIY